MDTLKPPTISNLELLQSMFCPVCGKLHPAPSEEQQFRTCPDMEDGEIMIVSPFRYVGAVPLYGLGASELIEIQSDINAMHEMMLDHVRRQQSDFGENL